MLKFSNVLKLNIQFLPQAYLGIRMNGNAILRYESDRKKIIDTLS